MRSGKNAEKIPHSFVSDWMYKIKNQRELKVSKPSWLNRESWGVGFWKEVWVEKHAHSQINKHRPIDSSSKRFS